MGYGRHLPASRLAPFHAAVAARDLLEAGMSELTYRPGLKCFHAFRKGTVIHGMRAYKKGLIVATSRGVYWFASLKSKPRKVKI